MNKKRIEWIDVAKGLGIILVVFLHLFGTKLINPNYLRFYTCFFMPLFFIISGFLAHPIKTKKIDYIIKISKCYLLPIIIYGLLTYLLTYLRTYVIFNFSAISNIYSDFSKEFIDTFIKNGNMLMCIGPAWFLWNLYLVICIFTIFNIIKLSNKNKILLCIILFLLGYILQIINMPHYLGLIRIPLTLGFYLLGHIISLYYSFIKSILKKNMFVYVISVVIMFTLYFIFGIILDGNFSVMRYEGNYLYSIIAAIAGSCMLCLLAYYLRNIKYLQEYGKNTLFILCVHIFLIDILLLILFNILNINLILSCLIIFLILLFIPNYICRFLNKYCPIMLGKTKK